MDLSLKNTTPWLVLAGSGSAADLIAGILKDLSTPLSPPVSPTLPTADEESMKTASVELRDRVRERIKKHFPSETELEKLVDQVSVQQESEYRGQSYFLYFYLPFSLFFHTGTQYLSQQRSDHRVPWRQGRAR